MAQSLQIFTLFSHCGTGKSELFSQKYFSYYVLHYIHDILMKIRKRYMIQIQDVLMIITTISDFLVNYITITTPLFLQSYLQNTDVDYISPHSTNLSY